MTRKAMIAAALTLLMSAPVFADTPIGKGVTGAGGTGPNTADVEARQREAKSPQPQALNPDGTEPSRAGAAVSGSKDIQNRARGATSVAPGAGSTGADPTGGAGMPATSGNIGGGEGGVVKPDPTAK